MTHYHHTQCAESGHQAGPEGPLLRRRTFGMAPARRRDVGATTSANVDTQSNGLVDSHTVEYLECLVRVISVVLHPRGWGRRKQERQRVNPTAHTHRTQDAPCSRITKIEPVSSQPTRNRQYWRVPTDKGYPWVEKGVNSTPK